MRWLIGGPNVNDRAMGRKLGASEMLRLTDIDDRFWSREIDIPTPGEMKSGDRQRRSSLALVYDPVENFDFFDYVDAVFVPREAESRAKAIAGDKVIITE